MRDTTLLACHTKAYYKLKCGFCLNIMVNISIPIHTHQTWKPHRSGQQICKAAVTVKHLRYEACGVRAKNRGQIVSHFGTVLRVKCDLPDRDGYGRGAIASQACYIPSLEGVPEPLGRPLEHTLRVLARAGRPGRV